jgi:hypothetical protein
MMRKLVVTTDFDRTLIADLSTTISIRAMNRRDGRAMLKRILEEPALGLRAKQINDYEKSMGRKVESREDIAHLAIWALYTDKTLDKVQVVAIKAMLATGMTEHELNIAIDAASAMLTNGATAYSKGISASGHTHIIMSDGWLPIINGVVKRLRNNGAEIHAVGGRDLVFRNGVFTGEAKNIDKWAQAIELYERLGFRQNRSGIFESAVAVDDSSTNLAGMLRHGLAIAFCPTEKEAGEFRKAGFGDYAAGMDGRQPRLIQDARDLRATLGMIEAFARANAE